MRGIFGRSSKNPAEVVRSLKEDLTTLEKGGDGKKQERVSCDYCWVKESYMRLTEFFP